MRFGCCGSMISPSSDPIGIEIAETLAAMGFDYIELSLAHIAALEESEFQKLARRLNAAKLPCEACNNFFPASVRLTGDEADLEKALEYAGVALRRAAKLGVKVVVFGSSGAKNVPEGFPHEKAWRQIVELLRGVGPLAAANGITIVIEPINKLEANIVNLAAEGLKLMREVDHPGIQLLIDFYHLQMETEHPRIILEADGAIKHVHFAKLKGRKFPVKAEASWSPFFNSLKKIHYSGRCSIEAYTDSFDEEARQALGVLQRAADGLG